jgi:hypothetical protein
MKLGLLFVLPQNSPDFLDAPLIVTLLSVVEERSKMGNQSQRQKRWKMSQLTQVGDFCPNEICSDYGKCQNEGQQSIIKFGQTKAGRQRYRCKSCGQTFTETKGTIFYRRRTSEEEILLQFGINKATVKRQEPCPCKSI